MLKSLYPKIDCYNSGNLKLDDIHTMYYEECGNPKGIPIVFIHGGPGGGVNPDCRRFFNPEKFRIILFDQRGAGKSTPHAELENNTTWHLVDDMELLREHLKIEKWHLFGGSWGSTLSLIYAIEHPEKVLSMTLRGLFMCRPEELHWFYQFGAHHIFPDQWESYKEQIPEAEREDFISAYYKRLTSQDKSTRINAAKTWSTWEGSTSKLVQDSSLLTSYSEDEFALAFARIECHYFYNQIFLKDPNHILNNLEKIKHIPCSLVHGRYDVVCPVKNAWEMHKLWPEMKLFIEPTSGHSAFEKDISAKLVELTDSIN
ncbi:MAG: prolyl aminopeptidase [Bdellovibrionales bacterium]|nr:prolyl aminopeptidase [Bdellovibrionales bacterium]